MQIKEIKAKGLSHELEVTVPANDIAKKREERLKEVGKTVKLPGFRPGKVPMKMLEQKYGRAVMGEVLEAVVNESTAKMLADKKLKPAMQPKIEVKGEFDEGKDLTFKVELEVLPQVSVKDLKGLKLEKPVVKVDQKQIDETLERIAAQHKDSKPIEDARAAKKGDIAIITFHGRTKDDNKAHEGMHAHDVKLELGSGQFIPGFEEQLTGKKAGDKVEVNVTFPENYGAAELAGREAVFDVDIEALHEAVPVTINDDFAKTLGFENEAKLREAVEHQVKSDYEGQSRMKIKRQLLDYLDDNHKFEVPQSMVEAEYKGILQQIEAERQQTGESVSDEEKEELQGIAERRVRLGLVLSEIGNQHKVNVSDQELQRAVILEAQKYPGQEKMVFEFYQKNKNALESLRAPIYEEKVCELIFKDAAITEKEVSAEELMADDEESNEKPKKKAAKKAPAKKAAAKK